MDRQDALVQHVWVRDQQLGALSDLSTVTLKQAIESVLQTGLLAALRRKLCSDSSKMILSTTVC